jgi:hypothetical protein
MISRDCLSGKSLTNKARRLHLRKGLLMIHANFKKCAFAGFLVFTYYLRFSRGSLSYFYVVARFIALLIILRCIPAISIIEAS